MLWDELKDGENSLDALMKMGFHPTVRLDQWSSIHFRGDPVENQPLTWRSFDISAQKLMRDTLIWCSISSTMGIRPSAPVTSFLVCPELDLMMNIYDDRGMDISSLSLDPLTPIYRDFNPWLLDYDRQRMARLFVKAVT